MVCSCEKGQNDDSVKELTKADAERVKALTSSGGGDTMARGTARGEGCPGREGPGESRPQNDASYGFIVTPSTVRRICRAVVSASTVAITTWDARAF